MELTKVLYIKFIINDEKGRFVCNDDSEHDYTDELHDWFNHLPEEYQRGFLQKGFNYTNDDLDGDLATNFTDSIIDELLDVSDYICFQLLNKNSYEPGREPFGGRTNWRFILKNKPEDTSPVQEWGYLSHDEILADDDD